MRFDFKQSSLAFNACHFFVEQGMIAFGNKSEITRNIIKFVSVDMVYHFSRSKFSSESPLHYESVFKNPDSFGNLNPSVSHCVERFPAFPSASCASRLPTHPCSATAMITKIPFTYCGRIPFYNPATLGALNFHMDIIP